MYWFWSACISTFRVSSHLHFCSCSTVMFSSIFFHSCVYYIFMFSYSCTVLSNFRLSSNIPIVLLLFIFFSCVLINFVIVIFSFYYFYFFHFIFISLTLHFILFQLHFYFFSLSHSQSYVSFIFFYLLLYSYSITQQNINLCSHSFQCFHLYNIYFVLMFSSILVLFHSYFYFIYINKFQSACIGSSLWFQSVVPVCSSSLHVPVSVYV